MKEWENLEEVSPNNKKFNFIPKKDSLSFFHPSKKYGKILWKSEKTPTVFLIMKAANLVSDKNYLVVTLNWQLREKSRKQT